MNIRVHISFPISVFIFFGYLLRSGIALSYISSIFNFLRKIILFSIMIAPMNILTNGAWGFPILHILASSCCLLSFLIIALCEVVSPCGLICICLMISDAEHFFHGPVVHLYVFFRKRSIQILCPFLSKLPFFGYRVVKIFWLLSSY